MYVCSLCRTVFVAGQLNFHVAEQSHYLMLSRSSTAFTPIFYNSPYPTRLPKSRPECPLLYPTFRPYPQWNYRLFHPLKSPVEL